VELNPKLQQSSTVWCPLWSEREAGKWTVEWSEGVWCWNVFDSIYMYLVIDIGTFCDQQFCNINMWVLNRLHQCIRPFFVLKWRWQVTGEFGFLLFNSRFALTL
jgi:hypothetical protein